MGEILPQGYVAESTADGHRIVRSTNRNALLEIYYMIYNKQCFKNELLFAPI